MSIGDFDNEANLVARRRWSERLRELVLEASRRLPSDLAGAQARESGAADPLSGLPEVVFEGLQDTRDDPEATVRGLLAYQRATGEIIIEMMRAHWEVTGSALAPP